MRIVEWDSGGKQYESNRDTQARRQRSRKKWWELR